MALFGSIWTFLKIVQFWLKNSGCNLENWISWRISLLWTPFLIERHFCNSSHIVFILHSWAIYELIPLIIEWEDKAGQFTWQLAGLKQNEFKIISKENWNFGNFSLDPKKIQILRFLKACEFLAFLGQYFQKCICSLVLLLPAY